LQTARHTETVYLQRHSQEYMANTSSKEPVQLEVTMPFDLDILIFCNFS